MKRSRRRPTPHGRTQELGWDTRVGVRGAAMSGGERQRLAPARALLADPSVLVLDEPSAHLDPPARAALTADLLQAAQRRGLLLITRDLAGLDCVDEIAVLAHGTILLRGTHSGLAGQDGPCRRMHELRTRGAASCEVTS